MLALKILVHRLPRANHSLLRALSAFLITIVNNSDQNKMTVRNGMCTWTSDIDRV